MSTIKDLLIPDIGDFDDVEVIEILVSAGDTISAEDSLITLETDKATMEVPASEGGRVVDVKVNVGDKVSKGSVVLTFEPSAVDADAEKVVEAPEATTESSAEKNATTASVEVVVPDIGDFDDVEVIEVLVSVGQTIKQEDSLVTLETDKATMEVPSSHAGTVAAINVNVGDRVSKGSVLVSLHDAEADSDSISSSEMQQDAESESTAPAEVPKPTAEPTSESTGESDPIPRPPASGPPPVPPPATSPSPTAHLSESRERKAHASPAVRRFARELGADINLITGSGPKNRILKSDVKEFIKNALSGTGAAYGGPMQGGAVGGAGIPPMPEIDFSKFGPIERVEMSRINKLSAANLHRAWLNVPHVTHHDEADITELEDFRKSLKSEAEKKGVRVTGLVFHMKALAYSLASFPKFNASMAPDGESLIFKKYFHIGIAVDTPNGLVVPVFKDVDKKSIFTLSEELMDVSGRAREKKLKPDEMQGASMTISSLGGIGGTAFTPIVNAPESAILGITRARMQPVWNGSDFVPRLMCPLDVSYDHRIIDGADAARFMACYCNAISDIRRLLL